MRTYDGSKQVSVMVKPSNPKDLVASKKLDLSVVPDSAALALAEAFLEGALKYGRFNWRVAGVSASTYVAALRRHVAKWYNGQRCDPMTRVHHLKNAMACLSIILDAEIYGMLNDDRPPCPDPDAMARTIDEAELQVAHLKEMFKDHSPIQYTQKWVDDTRRASEDAGGQAPADVPKPRTGSPLRAQAGAKRNGRASRGLSRKSRGRGVRDRNKVAR